MTSERAAAYGRVMTTISDLGASKLQPAECERLRSAADTLLFSETIGAPGARAALEDVEDLVEALVDSGRWMDERAHALFENVQACGPFTPVG